MNLVIKARQNRLNALVALRQSRSGKSASVMALPLFRSRRTADNLPYAPTLDAAYRGMRASA
jgi:hypothetical protein